MASVAVPVPVGAKLVEPRAPVRTCVGCRQRAVATELLRVVAAPSALVSVSPAGSAESADRPPAAAVAAVPDPRRRAAGRGAWVHPVPGCLDLAERRRAFGRALRVSGTVDCSAVRAFVDRLGDPTGGIPQE